MREGRDRERGRRKQLRQRERYQYRLERGERRQRRKTIDLPPGTYPFVCRFHESMGMTGTLVVRS